MKSFRYSDSAESRGREPRLYFLTQDVVEKFSGKSIPGVCLVDRDRYTKAGPWSSSVYDLVCPDHVVPVRVIRPFEGWGTTWSSITEEVSPILKGDVISLEEKIRVVRQCSLDNPDWERLAEAIRQADENEAASIDDLGSVIVTRHAGLVEWLARRGITGEVKAQATAEDVRGKIVYGVLPLHLAALAAEVWTVDMPDLAPDQRGKDLSPAEMDAAGATLRGYRVIGL